jgi:hypothetical protein
VHILVDAHRAGDASTSTPQKSKMKPWQSDEVDAPSSVGAVSCGGVQNTVSRSLDRPRRACPAPNGAAAATRPNGKAPLSGIAFARMRSPANIDLIGPAH